MKIKSGYLLRDVGSNHVVVAADRARLDFDGMISLNDVGAFLWRRLAEGVSRENLIDALLAEYDVDRARADADLTAFLTKLTDNHLLEEED